MLGSRRIAERYIQEIPYRKGTVSFLLFDIEGYRKINDRYGALFGDKLLQAFGSVLRENFPGEGSVFRWGSDEFLALVERPSNVAAKLCLSICEGFANSNYITHEDGRKERVTATVAWGVAQYTNGESTEELRRRARVNLEHNQRGMRR